MSAPPPEGVSSKRPVLVCGVPVALRVSMLTLLAFVHWVDVPVLDKTCPLLPALPRLSTKAACKTVVAWAVVAPLTTKSAVSVLFPETLKVPLTV